MQFVLECLSKKYERNTNYGHYLGEIEKKASNKYEYLYELIDSQDSNIYCQICLEPPPMSFASNGIITSPYNSKVDGKIIGI